MIIWGSRGLTSVIDTQAFHCPQCNAQSDGLIKQVKNYFTLYFIPVIPLNVAGRYVECHSCAGTFGEEILSYDPAIEKQKNIDQMMRVMVMAALADGIVNDGERAEINRQYMELAGLPIPPQKLDEQIKLAMQSGANLNSMVASFAHELSGHGKALLIKLAFLTMTASGELQPGHQTQLAQLSKTLGIPEDQYMTFIDQLSSD